MKKSAEAFRSIGEVAKLIGVAPHVLRYWETQFPQLKPMKRPDGRRYYRPEDVRLVAGLCEVLRDDGMTIRGAKKLISKDRGEAIRQRGAERLEEAMGTASPPPSAEILAPIPEPIDAEDDSMPQHAPRSRQRRRKTSDGGALPLFPDLDPGAAAQGWLAQLSRLSARMRATDPEAPEWQQAAPRAAALREAIIAHYETA